MNYIKQKPDKLLTLEVLPDYYNYIQVDSIFMDKEEIIYAQNNLVITAKGNKNSLRLYINYIHEFSLKSETDKKIYQELKENVKIHDYLHCFNIISADVYGSNNHIRFMGDMLITSDDNIKTFRTINLIELGLRKFDVLQKFISNLVRDYHINGNFDNLPKTYQKVKK